MADEAKTMNTTGESRGFTVKIVSPEKTVFDGICESVTVKTTDGYEGFLRGRAACCKLLAENGRISLRKKDESSLSELTTQGGFLYMNDTMLIYTDKAEQNEA